MKVSKKIKHISKNKPSKDLKVGLKNGKVKKFTTKEKVKKTFKTKLKKNNDLGKMSVDDFMDEEESLSNDEDSLHSDEEQASIENIMKQTKDDENSENEEGSDSETEEKIDIDEFKSHKQSLNKLKEIDPDFYKFLEENDKKLLNFNISDSEAEDNDADDDDDEEKEDSVHKPSDDLEVASDEDDFVVSKICFFE